MTSILNLLLVCALGTFLAVRLKHKPHELPIYALILCSTFPFITQGYLLALGERGSALRLEYLLPALGVVLAYLSKGLSQPAYPSRLRLPVLAMLALYSSNLLVSWYHEVPFGVGVATKLVETYLFFFIFVRLTRRDRLSGLVHAFIAVGAVVTSIFLVLTISNNEALYNFLFKYRTPAAPNGFDYYYQHLGQVYNRVWANEADQFLLLPAVMAVVLFMVQPRRRWLFGLLAGLFICRAILSGERSIAASTLLGAAAALLLLFRLRPTHVKALSMFGGAIGLALALLVAFTYVPSLQSRFEMLVARTMTAQTELVGQQQWTGAELAQYEIANVGWHGWLFGISAFLSSEMGPAGYDINSYILMVYRFGWVGLLAVAFFSWRVLWLAYHMLTELNLGPEELAIVLACPIYVVIMIGASFLRGFALSEDFHSLAGLVMNLAWMEVIYRDALVRTAAKAPVGPAYRPVPQRGGLWVSSSTSGEAGGRRIPRVLR